MFVFLGICKRRMCCVLCMLYVPEEAPMHRLSLLVQLNLVVCDKLLSMVGVFIYGGEDEGCGHPTFNGLC